MNWEIEAIGVFASFCYLARWVLQIKATKKAKRSVNPIAFWVLTWTAVTSMAVYGYLLGSLVMPLGLPISWIVIGYNIKTELKRKESGKK